MKNFTEDRVSPFRPFQLLTISYITAYLYTYWLKMKVEGWGFIWVRIRSHSLSNCSLNWGSQQHIVLRLIITSYSVFATPILCHTPTTQLLFNSLWICHNAGWCHSVLLFSTGILHLLIKTASLTCLERQSLELPVTLAVYSPAAPWCFLFWCFFMNDLPFPFLYLLVCSLALVNRFLAVSPMYWLLSSAGQSWHSIW